MTVHGSGRMRRGLWRNDGRATAAAADEEGDTTQSYLTSEVNLPTPLRPPGLIH